MDRCVSERACVVMMRFIGPIVVYFKLFYSASIVCLLVVFFFQAEDGIRDLVRSRGLGDVYKRQL